MARKINRPSPRKVETIKARGQYADGNGLYLQVGPTGAKSWVYRYMLNGRPRWQGLGPLHTVTLATARVKAGESRELVRQGLDPIKVEKAKREQRHLDAARSVTFRDCAERYIASHEAGWKNAKHGDQWRNTLRDYVYPPIGPLPVGDIDTGLVMTVLEPIWTTKPEMANRVRGRIESILDYAKTLNYRKDENPSRWKGHLQNLLPARSKVRKVRHHPALPYTQLGDFMAELRTMAGVSPKGLEFLILTAARTGEVIGAVEDEMDLDADEWIVPADRMKQGKEHRVPLSLAALGVLRHMSERRQSEYVFPGNRPGEPLSNMAFLSLLKRMGYGEFTGHGFRSTFRDWAAEQTNFPSEVSDMALAHAVSDRTERAYRRGELLKKRRQLMGAWAKFCDTPSAKRGGNVVSIAKGRG